MHQKPIGQGGSGVSELEALLIAQSERDNLELITRIIHEENLDVDFWRGHLCKGAFGVPHIFPLTPTSLSQSMKPRRRPILKLLGTTPGSMPGKGMVFKATTIRR